MPSWDPTQYLRFADHRTRPVRDLLAAVVYDHPAGVVDVGCGPGNSTALLAERWPGAGLIGIDSSAEMIERARASLPGVRFVVADLRRWQPPSPVDVVFSNATLHWVEDHRGVFERLVSWLAPGGVLAVQMPANFDRPSHVLMRELAASRRWSGRLGDVLRSTPVRTPSDYYRVLARAGRTVDIWTTEYLHALTGEDPVVQWVAGSALRPLLDLLEGADAADFLSEYTDAVREAYPPETDGTTLFPFRRMFIVCRV
ncbi:MAG: trans-aconitate 2-methyltransferase [Acidimicrobiia bacterium]